MNRLPHTQNIYTDNNTTVYRHIFEATLGTQYAATISPFKCARNWRGACLHLKHYSVEPACWGQDIKYTMKFLVNRKCTGNTGLSLYAFLKQYCALYTMHQCWYEHVQHQLPDTRQMAKFILDNVDYKDSDVQAKISSIRIDDVPYGLINYF